MNISDIEKAVQSILAEYFDIETGANFWDTPLVTLSEKFNLISYLLTLEQLLQSQLFEEIRLIEDIDVGIDTPKYLVILIKSQLKNSAK